MSLDRLGGYTWADMDSCSRKAFARMWFDGMPLAEIAERLGVTVSIVSKERVRQGLPRRCGTPDPPPPDPQTIRLRCAEVRTAWDFVTYKLRWQGMPHNE